MKAKGKFKPTIGQAFKMLLCALFRVEMDLEIDAERVGRTIRTRSTFPEEGDITQQGQ